jgi:4,5-DOPA dioxygenase extradiol
VSRQPVLFLGHGAPTLAIDAGKGAALRSLGEALPRPESALVISAHWETVAPTLGAVEPVPLIHDYGGFDPAIRDVVYPSPGAPALAERIRELLPGVEATPGRGLDHGVWTPLVHLWPEADVPVLQLSLPRGDLVELGRRLAPLRDEGVLLIGSGSLTHHLGRMRPDGAPPPEDVVAFDAWVVDRLEAGDHPALIDAAARVDFARHHPTSEHWEVLLPLLGAVDPGEPVTYPVEGFEFGALSRRSVRWG